MTVQVTVQWHQSRFNQFPKLFLCPAELTATLKEGPPLQLPQIASRQFWMLPGPIIGWLLASLPRIRVAPIAV